MKVIQSGSPSDVKKLKVKIDGQDVTPMVIRIRIYQDIFLPAWSAIVTFEDDRNLMMILPIKPGSKLTVEVETKVDGIFDGSKVYNFLIYGHGNKQFLGQMHYAYDLYCATNSFLVNQNNRVQKAYIKKYPEDIVADVCTEYLSGALTKVDKSDEKYDIIIPNWSPFISNWWAAKVAIIQGRSDYVFFMNDHDMYTFKSIEKMFNEDDSGITFKQRPTNIRQDKKEIVPDYCPMITKYHTDHYNAVGNLKMGYYVTKMNSFNMIEKKWEEKLFSYGDDLPPDKEKKPWDIYDSAVNSNVSFMPKHPGLHEDQTIDDQVSTWHTSRKSNIMKLDQNKMLIQVAGGANTWQMLGKFCRVELPTQEDWSGEKQDKFLKGKHLITHIMHHITSDQYNTNFELCKKRLEEKM